MLYTAHPVQGTILYPIYSKLSKLNMFTIDTEFAFLITDTDQDTADTTDLFKMAAEVTII